MPVRGSAELPAGKRTARAGHSPAQAGKPCTADIVGRPATLSLQQFAHLHQLHKLSSIAVTVLAPGRPGQVGDVPVAIAVEKGRIVEFHGKGRHRRGKAKIAAALGLCAALRPQAALDYARPALLQRFIADLDGQQFIPACRDPGLFLVFKGIDGNRRSSPRPARSRRGR